MSIAAFFDHPYDIERVSETQRGRRDQTTGAWLPATTSITLIDGSFHANPQIVNELGQAYHFEEGEALLYTAANLKTGDKLRVHHDTTGTNFTTYRVVQRSSTFDTVGQYIPEFARAEFKLMREGEP